MTKKSKAVQQIIGPEEVDGKIVAEDGGEVTPALQEIYDYTEENKGNSTVTLPDTIDDKSQPLATSHPKAIITDVFNVPKLCRECYLQDKCLHFSSDATCHYRIEVNISNPQDLVDLMKMLLTVQGERVLFGRLIEQTEGGYIDRNLSEEMERMITMMEKFKGIMTNDNSSEITVKVKGDKAVETAANTGILSQIFGQGDKK